MPVLRLLLLVLACLALAGPAQAATMPQVPQANVHAAHVPEAHAAASPAHGAAVAAAESACPDHLGAGAAPAGHDAGHGCCDPATADCAGHCAHGVPALPASAPAGAGDAPHGPPVARLRGGHLAPPPAPLLRPPIA